MAKPKLDKDLKRLSRLEYGLQETGRGLLPVTLCVLFLVLTGLAVASMFGFGAQWAIVIAASVVGGYMALNIGANDVANNMSPAVGSRALTIVTAVIIAAICEAAGAIIAGGDVVTTVSSRIIDPQAIGDPEVYVRSMIAALFAAALWINIATLIGAPVSTTHSVIGGVLGAGVMAAGFGAANWSMVMQIVASWVISPVFGGVVAAVFLAYIERSILNAHDKVAAARVRVPILVGIMAGAFGTYLQMKGLSQLMPVPFWLALTIGALIGVLFWLLSRPYVGQRVQIMENHKNSIGSLFTIPVIGGAALLSFAHGSNDVANAVGPLAAIYAAVAEGGWGQEVELPFWILLIGALGIAVGLLLYGPKLIRTVGSKITKLNRVRAFCVTLSAGITVIIASALGLPVSSTHIAIGSLFGVGFLRELLVNWSLSNSRTQTNVNGDPEKLKRRYLVRRSHMFTIIAAWLITVPATAAIAAVIAFALGLTGWIDFV